MKKLNWLNMWSEMKKGSGSILVLGLIFQGCSWIYRAVTHSPEPERSLAGGLIWLSIGAAYLLSLMFVGLLTDDRR